MFMNCRGTNLSRARIDASLGKPVVCSVGGEDESRAVAI